jgi:hypothetical protein
MNVALKCFAFGPASACGGEAAGLLGGVVPPTDC